MLETKNCVKEREAMNYGWNEERVKESEWKKEMENGKHIMPVTRSTSIISLLKI